MVSLGSFGGGMAGGASVNIIIRGVDKFSKTFARAAGGLKSLGSVAGMAVKSIAAVGVAAGVAAVAIGTASVKAFGNYETGMRKVQTLMGEGKDSIEAYGDEVRRMAKELPVAGGVAEVSAGLYQTLSAGIEEGAVATQFLEKATKAAIGGSAALPDVIMASTKTMAAFGIEAEDAGRVFDVFAGVVKAGQTDLGQLAMAFPTVAGTAAEMGATLEETSGVFAALTKVMKSPEASSTALNAVFTGLLKPSEDMKDAFKELGVESGQAAIEQFGLMGTLEKLKGVAKGDSEAMGELFGNVRALRAVFPLLGGAADEVTTSMGIIGESTGMADKQFQDMAGTTENQMIQLKNNVKDAFIDIGAKIAPILNKIVQKIIPMVEPVMQMLMTMAKQVIPPIMAVGRVLIGMFQTAWTIIKPIVSVLVKNFKSLFTTIVKFLQSPGFQSVWGLIANAFKLIGALISFIMPVIRVVINGVRSILNTLAPLFDFLSWVIGKLAGWISGASEKMNENADAEEKMVDANDAYNVSVEESVDGGADFIEMLGAEEAAHLANTDAINAETGALLNNAEAKATGGRSSGSGTKWLLNEQGKRIAADTSGVAGWNAGGGIHSVDAAGRVGARRGAVWQEKFGATPDKFDDFIMRPGQKPIGFSSKDTIVGTKGGRGMGNTIIININDGTLVGEQAAQELANNVSRRMAASLSSQWSVGIG